MEGILDVELKYGDKRVAVISANVIGSLIESHGVEAAADAIQFAYAEAERQVKAKQPQV